MKHILRGIALMLLVYVLVGCQSTPPQSEKPVPSITALMTTVADIDKYGDIRLSLTVKELLAAGFDYADLVQVTFLDKKLIVPLIPAYRYVAAKEAALVAFVDKPDRAIELEIFNGSFADTYGIATKTIKEDRSYFWTPQSQIAFPINITITLAQKNGYYKSYLLFDLKRTNERNDYSDKTDEQFANFRMITTTGIGTHKLYRSSSPINPDIGRNSYADKAAASVEIKTCMNLADHRAAAEKYAGYSDSYYAKQNVCFLGLGVDFSVQANRDGLAEGLRFFLAHEPPYLLHCNEGQDRAGFVSAVLECLMGASLTEVIDDYMTTYENYYGVKKESDQYKAISENIVKHLRTAFGVENIEKANLSVEAAEYLQEIGLTYDEVSAFKLKLSM